MQPAFFSGPHLPQNEGAYRPEGAAREASGGLSAGAAAEGGQEHDHASAAVLASSLSFIFYHFINFKVRTALGLIFCDRNVRQEPNARVRRVRHEATWF